MRRLLSKWNGLLGAVVGLVCVSCLVTACVDTGGDDDMGGGSTVRGLVASFNGQPGGGVQVSVAGTDLATTTTDDGMFVLSGVPPGSQTVIFERDNQSASLRTDVPERGTVELEDVRVQSDRVDVGNINVTESAPPPPADNMMQASSREDNSGPGSANSGRGSDNSGSGSDNSGSGNDDDDEADDDRSGSSGNSGPGGGSDDDPDDDPEDDPDDDPDDDNSGSGSNNSGSGGNSGPGGGD